MFRTVTFASLKLRRRASLLAPVSCTLAMDMTLPKREKDATCSSFSLRVLASVRGVLSFDEYTAVMFASLQTYQTTCPTMKYSGKTKDMTQTVKIPFR